jgi:hypothetical protein
MNIKSGIERPNFKDRTGEKYITNEGYEIEIIEYFNSLNCTIRFLYNGYTKYNVSFGCVKRGEIKNPFHISICGIGYFGVGYYKATVNKNTTPVYYKWVGMLQRCYNKNHQEKHPTYIDCTVVEEWHNFQVFAKWYEKNHIEGFELDKDILVKDNKIYSPETCCFVPSEINMLFSETGIKNKSLPKGVCLNNGSGKKYICTFSKMYLGKFDTIEETLKVYKEAKKQHIKEIADKWKDLIDPRVYNILINYK